MDTPDPMQAWLTTTGWPYLDALLGAQDGHLIIWWGAHPRNTSGMLHFPNGVPRAVLRPDTPPVPGLLAAPWSAHALLRIQPLQAPFFAGVEAHLGAMLEGCPKDLLVHLRLTRDATGHHLRLDAGPNMSPPLATGLPATTPDQRQVARAHIDTALATRQGGILPPP